MKYNKGDLVRVNIYGSWTVNAMQKPMFHRYDLLAIILEETTSQMYRVHILSDDKIAIIHEEDIKCIES